MLGIIFLGELGFLILLDLGLWQFKPHTRPTSTYNNLLIFVNNKYPKLSNNQRFELLFLWLI